MTDFTDRLALVTGAASGIGFATARHLAARGARLVLVDRDEPELARAAEALGPAVAAAVPGDVADEALWEALVPKLEGLGLALVNAGVAGAGPIAELDFAEWRRILSVNLDGAFLTLRAAMRAMDGRGGAIVLTASASGLKAEPGVAAYGASKAAVIHLAKVAARESAAQGIRVNAIAPGGVETPIWRGMAFFDDLVAAQGSEEAAFAAMAGMATPLGRYATAEEVAAQIAFLLSDEAATVTGAVLTSDGGYTL
ncbi:MAG TPA: SDR family oxidoreductase [Sphingomonas sp.]|nr:SDR family oxidoreductase [Sphingomonas sp.]